MSEPTADRLPIKLELIDPPRHKRHFIKMAVCELRYAVLLDFDDKVFQRLYGGLRKTYPHFNKGVNVNIGVSEAREPQYTITSKDNAFTAVFRPASIVLQAAADRYTDFREIESRLQPIVAALTQQWDVDFFTRVGLRFTNMLPIVGNDPRDWVHPRLLAPFIDGELGRIESVMQEIRGDCNPRGRFILKIGVAPDLQDERGQRPYVIDIDAYEEDVEPEELSELLVLMNRNIYAIFKWTLGAKALAFLDGKEG